MKRILHLEQLIAFVQSHANSEENFEEIYRKLEEEYALISLNKEECQVYFDDLHLTLHSQGKRYLKLRTKGAFRQFVLHFITDLETELFRIKKASHSSVVN